MALRMLKTFPARPIAASYSSRRSPSASSTSIRRMCGTRLPGLREAEVDLARGRVGPAARDRLRPRVEVDALRAVDVPVTEERALPAAERVVGDRHRDGYVDPHHPDVHVELE